MAYDNVAALSIGLTLDSTDYKQALNSTTAVSNRVFNNLSAQANSFAARWEEITKNIRSTKSVLSSMALYATFKGIAAAVTDVSAAVANFSMNMETAEIAMRYFVDGSDKAAKSLEYLREMQELAAKTSFTTESAINLSQFMSAMGINLKVTKSVMTVINDAAAATGSSEENMSRIVTALGQILTKGRLAAEEVRQLANANIPIYEILKEEMQLTGEQIKNIGNYWIDANDSVVAILRGLQTRYKGAADDVAETMSGMLNAVKDNSLMVGKIATSGAYDALEERLRGVRNALDEYREVAVNQGSTALFRTLLLDADASGKLGTGLLTLIGNARQLIDTAGNLYTTAKPLIAMLGQGLYYSISTLTVGVTALGEVLNSADSLLSGFGISLEEVFKLCAGVFIVYRVAKTFGYVGQAAAALAVKLWGAANSMVGILPAALTASTGLKLTSLGLIGAGAAALYLTGALDGVLQGLAGLSTSDGGLPSDFEKAFSKYEEQMEAYNAAIKKYEGTFDESFESIASAGTAAFNLVQEKATKSAKKASDSWLASFDEVYKVPEDSAADDDNTLSFPDLTALVDKLGFIFPAKVEAELVMPDFDWDSVYDQDIQGGVLDALNAWTPLLLLGVSGGFAQAFKKNFAKDAAKKAGPPAPEIAAAAKAAERAEAAAASFNNLEKQQYDALTRMRKEAGTSMPDQAAFKEALADFKAINKKYLTAAAASSQSPVDFTQALRDVQKTFTTSLAENLQKAYNETLAWLEDNVDLKATDTPQYIAKLDLADTQRKQLDKLVTSNEFLAAKVETTPKVHALSIDAQAARLDKKVNKLALEIQQGMHSIDPVKFDDIKQSLKTLNSTLQRVGLANKAYTATIENATLLLNYEKAIKQRDNTNLAKLVISNIRGTDSDAYRELSKKVEAFNVNADVAKSFLQNNIPTLRSDVLNSKIDDLVADVTRIYDFEIERNYDDIVYAISAISRPTGKSIRASTEKQLLSEYAKVLNKTANNLTNRMAGTISAAADTVAKSVTSANTLALNADALLSTFSVDFSDALRAFGFSDTEANSLANAVTTRLKSDIGDDIQNSAKYLSYINKHAASLTSAILTTDQSLATPEYPVRTSFDTFLDTVTEAINKSAVGELSGTTQKMLDAAITATQFASRIPTEYSNGQVGIVDKLNKALANTAATYISPAVDTITESIEEAANNARSTELKEAVIASLKRTVPDSMLVDITRNITETIDRTLGDLVDDALESFVVGTQVAVQEAMAETDLVALVAGAAVPNSIMQRATATMHELQLIKQELGLADDVFADAAETISDTLQETADEIASTIASNGAKLDAGVITDILVDYSKASANALSLRAIGKDEAESILANKVARYMSIFEGSLNGAGKSEHIGRIINDVGDMRGAVATITNAIHLVVPSLYTLEHNTAKYLPLLIDNIKSVATSSYGTVSGTFMQASFIRQSIQKLLDELVPDANSSQAEQFKKAASGLYTRLSAEDGAIARRYSAQLLRDNFDANGKLIKQLAENAAVSQEVNDTYYKLSAELRSRASMLQPNTAATVGSLAASTERGVTAAFFTANSRFARSGDIDVILNGISKFGKTYAQVLLTSANKTVKALEGIVDPIQDTYHVFTQLHGDITETFALSSFMPATWETASGATLYNNNSNTTAQIDGFIRNSEGLAPVEVKTTTRHKAFRDLTEALEILTTKVTEAGTTVYLASKEFADTFLKEYDDNLYYQLGGISTTLSAGSDAAYDKVIVSLTHIDEEVAEVRREVFARRSAVYARNSTLDTGAKTSAAMTEMRNDLVALTNSYIDTLQDNTKVIVVEISDAQKNAARQAAALHTEARKQAALMAKDIGSLKNTVVTLTGTGVPVGPASAYDTVKRAQAFPVLFTGGTMSESAGSYSELTRFLKEAADVLKTGDTTRTGKVLAQLDVIQSGLDAIAQNTAQFTEYPSVLQLTDRIKFKANRVSFFGDGKHVAGAYTQLTKYISALKGTQAAALAEVNDVLKKVPEVLSIITSDTNGIYAIVESMADGTGIRAVDWLHGVAQKLDRLGGLGSTFAAAATALRAAASSGIIKDIPTAIEALDTTFGGAATYIKYFDKLRDEGIPVHLLPDAGAAQVPEPIADSVTSAPKVQTTKADAIKATKAADAAQQAADAARKAEALRNLEAVFMPPLDVSKAAETTADATNATTAASKATVIFDELADVLSNLDAKEYTSIFRRLGTAIKSPFVGKHLSDLPADIIDTKWFTKSGTLVDTLTEQMTDMLSGVANKASTLDQLVGNTFISNTPMFDTGMSTFTARSSFNEAVSNLLDANVITADEAKQLTKDVKQLFKNLKENSAVLNRTNLTSILSSTDIQAQYAKILKKNGAAAANEFLETSTKNSAALFNSLKANQEQAQAILDAAYKLVDEGVYTNVDKALKGIRKNTGFSTKVVDNLISVNLETAVQATLSNLGDTLASEVDDIAAAFTKASKLQKFENIEEAFRAISGSFKSIDTGKLIQAAERLKDTGVVTSIPDALDYISQSLRSTLAVDETADAIKAFKGLAPAATDAAAATFAKTVSAMQGATEAGIAGGIGTAARSLVSKTLTGASTVLKALTTGVAGISLLDIGSWALEAADAVGRVEAMRKQGDNAADAYMSYTLGTTLPEAADLNKTAGMNEALYDYWTSYAGTYASIATQAGMNVAGTVVGAMIEGFVTGAASTSFSGPGALIGGAVASILTGIVSSITIGDGSSSFYNTYAKATRDEAQSGKYYTNLVDAGYSEEGAAKIANEQTRYAEITAAASAHDSKVNTGRSLFSGFFTQEVDVLKKSIEEGAKGLVDYDDYNYYVDTSNQVHDPATAYVEAFAAIVEDFEKKGRAALLKPSAYDNAALLKQNSVYLTAEYNLLKEQLGGGAQSIIDFITNNITKIKVTDDLYAFKQAVQGLDDGVALLEEYTGQTIDLYNLDAATQVSIAEQIRDVYKQLSLQAANEVAVTQLTYSAASEWADKGGLVLGSLANQSDRTVADVKRFAEEMGLTVKSVEDFTGRLDTASLKGLYNFGVASDDMSEFTSKLAGWTVALPDSIDLKDISTDELNILASAGISIDTNGITFARAQNDDASGAERAYNYESKYVSDSQKSALANGAGITITKDNRTVIDPEFMRKNVSSAAYKVPAELFGNFAKSEATILAGYKEIVDSQNKEVKREYTNEGLGKYNTDTGYFEITNAAILRGEKTIADWIAENEINTDTGESIFTKETKDALLSFQDLMGKNFAQFAAAVNYKTDLTENSLGEYTKTGTKGVEFSQYGNDTIATISNYGEDLAKGVIPVLTNSWDSLPGDLLATLDVLGVDDSKRQGLYTLVDIGNTLEKNGDALIAMYSAVPEMMSSLSAGAKQYLQSVGLLSEDGSLLTWSQRTGSAIGTVNDTFAVYTDLLPGYFTDALNTVAEGDANFKQLMDSQMITFNTLTKEELETYQNTAQGCAYAFDDVPGQILYDYSLAHGYITDEMEGITADNIHQCKELRDKIAGIEFTAAFEESFVGSKQVFKSALMQLKEQLSNGKVGLTEEAAQIGLAVAAAIEDGLKEGLEKINLAQEKLTLTQEVADITRSKDNRVLSKDGETWWYDTSADKTAGKYNGIAEKDGGYEVYYNGWIYTVPNVTSKNEALEDVYYKVFKKAYKNSNSERLGIEGYANGGILNDDGLYRIAEQNKAEAIIPLENPVVSGHIGAAMTRMLLASSEWKKLSAISGVRDGGISTRLAEERYVNNAAAQQRSNEDNISGIADAVLQRVLPAMQQTSSTPDNDSRPPVYVGTLIADDTGLRELNKRMQVIEAKETRRR